ncbi:MAG: hypothetical protein ACLQVN_03025 [Bryobacteraceae bacterium]
MSRARALAGSAVYWLSPPLVCLALHWYDFRAWFRTDDFAWLGLTRWIYTWQALGRALFLPLAEGTIRPWSERAFFMAGYSLFGLDALPYRIVIFATQFASLVLVAWIGRRLTGSAAAGWLATLFWMANSSTSIPLGWASAYNQVQCGLFLLAAFALLLRYVETGRRGYSIAQWVVFVLGFGALEVMIVYPAVAAAYALLCAPRYFRRTLSMAPVSVAYFLIHRAVAPPVSTGAYVMHFSPPSLLGTLFRYWTWSVGPVYLRPSYGAPPWLLDALIALLSAALAAFAVNRWRAGRRAAAFCLAWFVLVIAPVLPLRDHVTEYYPYLPVIGLCWLGSWAVVHAWGGGAALKSAACAAAAAYLLMVAPQMRASARWNYRVSVRVRNLVEGLAGAHQLHPRQQLVLDGVDSELFWHAIRDHASYLLGIEHLYITPESAAHIETHPDIGDLGEFLVAGGVLAENLANGRALVYDVREPRLRNITNLYASQPHSRDLPLRIDPSDLLISNLLSPDWYPIDVDHRWMPARASVTMRGPPQRGMALYLNGSVTSQQLAMGPVILRVAVDGATLGAARIGANNFEFRFRLPDGLVGKPQILVDLSVSRTFRPPGDYRDLGMSFGLIAIR